LEELSVRVLEVDLVRKRIALSAKRGSEAQVGGASGERPAGNPGGGRPDQGRDRRPQAQGRPQGGGKQAPAAPGFKNNPFADHFRK